MLLNIKANDTSNIVNEYYKLTKKLQPLPIILFNATLFNYKQYILKHTFFTKYLPYINIFLCYEFGPWNDKTSEVENIIEYGINVMKYAFLGADIVDGFNNTMPTINQIISCLSNHNYNKLFTEEQTIYNDYNSILYNTGHITILWSNIIHNALHEKQKKYIENNQKINNVLKQFIGTNRLYAESLLYGLCEFTTSEDMYNIINFTHIICKSITNNNSIPGIIIGTKQFHNSALYCLNKISGYYNINVSDYYTDTEINNFLQKCYVNFNFKLIDKLVSRFISIFIQSTQKLEKIMNETIDDAMNTHYNIGIIHSGKGLSSRDYSTASDIVNSLFTSTMLNSLSHTYTKTNKYSAIFAVSNYINIDSAIKSRCTRLQLTTYTPQTVKNIICGYFMQQLSLKCPDEYIIFNINDVLKILYSYLSHIYDIEKVKEYIDLCIYYIIANRGIITMENIITSII